MIEVIFFPNGNTAVCKDCKQIPELQESWLLLYVNFLLTKGIDPTEVDFWLPTGKAKVFKTPKGYEWKIIRG